MATPFLGEIRMFGGNFAPYGWALCNGQLLQIDAYSALFALLGTTYGGNGTTTFGLPDLQGRIPLHTSTGYIQGQKAGEENHTLTIQEIPAHPHAVAGMGTGTTNVGPANLYGGGGLKAYKAAPSGTMNAAVVKNNPGGQPHNNMMPFLVVTFIIALDGIFPVRN
jgi:microcystin-dependent protein